MPLVLVLNHRRVQAVNAITVVHLTICNNNETFWTHAMELLGDMGHVESCFGPFGDRGSVGAR